MSAAVAAMTMLAACGGAPTPDSVNEKIQKGEELTMADYKVIFDYEKEMTKELSKIMESDDTDENAFDDLQKKYKYAEEFGPALEKGLNSGKIDEETAQKWQNEMINL